MTAPTAASMVASMAAPTSAATFRVEDFEKEEAEDVPQPPEEPQPLSRRYSSIGSFLLRLSGVPDPTPPRAALPHPPTAAAGPTARPSRKIVNTNPMPRSVSLGGGAFPAAGGRRGRRRPSEIPLARTLEMGLNPRTLSGNRNLFSPSLLPGPKHHSHAVQPHVRRASSFGSADGPEVAALCKEVLDLRALVEDMSCQIAALSAGRTVRRRIARSVYMAI